MLFRYALFQTCSTTSTAKADPKGEENRGVQSFNFPTLIIPLAIIQDPRRLFMAVKFNFAASKDVPMENVKFQGIFHDKSEMEHLEADNRTGEENALSSYKKLLDIDKEAREYAIVLSGLILQGVNWDYER